MISLLFQKLYIEYDIILENVYCIKCSILNRAWSGLCEETGLYGAAANPEKWIIW